ncbi:hypothetical protein Tco_0004676 [Tanacetum coccineum]
MEMTRFKPKELLPYGMLLTSHNLPPSPPSSPPNSPIFDTTPLPPSPNSSNPTSSFLPPQISTQNHSENHLHELLHLSNLLDINIQHAIELTNRSPPSSPFTHPPSSPTLSLFHDDPYMKVMQAYYTKESLIPPPTIVPPSPMLSPMFNPQEFFLPKELLPHKKQGHNQSPSSTSALPQAFEIGESSYELSLDRIEHIEDKIEGLGKGQVRHQEDKESLLDAIYELKNSQEGPSDY